MLHQRSFTLVLTCLALSFTTACSKCSNAAPSTREEYIQKLDAICQKADKEADELGKKVGKEMMNPNANPKETTVKMMEAGLALDDTTLEQMKKVAPIAADDAAMKEIWAQQDKVIGTTKAYVAVLKRGLNVTEQTPQEERDAVVADGDRFQKEMDAENDQLKALANKFGFRVCFEQSKSDAKK